MKSLARKVVSTAYDNLGRVNDILNGPDPRFVSYRENGKDKKIENLNLNSGHCHSFIGKMKVDGTGTYSDDVITALLKYFFDHTKKGEKVVVELANKVSELLNGEESMEGNMKYEEQKQHILELAKDLNKKRMNDLEIVDIQDNNKRLFDVLENEGINGLDDSIGTPDFQKPFDSLDIAKYLYYVAKKDKKYLEEIKNLKSEEFRQIPGDSDYYGLVEMAIRINSLLHGITLQGGVARQKKYDALLMKHINPYIKDFPLLDEFQKNCRDYLKGETFKGLYFDTEGSEKLVNKIDAKNQLKLKIKKALLLALGLGIGVGATNLANNYLQGRNNKKATEETIKEIFENKKTNWSGDMAYGEYIGKEKLEKINEYMQRIYDRFIFRYGSIGNFGKEKFGEEKFKTKILNCLNNQEVLDMFGSEGIGMETLCIEDQIIDDYLIPQNIGEFKLNNIPTKPYENLRKHTDQFINTFLLEDNIVSDKMMINKWQFTKTPLMEEIGEFTPKDIGHYGFSGMKNKIFVTTNGKNNQNYIMASDNFYKKIEDEGDYKISTNNAKILITDFLYQTQPVVPTLVDQYILRYYKWDNPRSYNSKGPEKNKLPGEIVNLLLKDFLKKGLLYKIKSNQVKEIDNYLDQFVIENSDILKTLNKEKINPNLLPNGFMQEYEDALKNTIKEKDGILNNYMNLPVTSFGKNNTVDHIGRYQALDGKIYKVGVVEMKGKKYIYAEQFGRKNYGSDSETYCTYEGSIVARDYLKQNKPIIKELVDLFFCRYYGDHRPEELWDYMEELLINDFVSKGFLESTDGLNAKEGKNDLLVKYIDDCVKRNIDSFNHRNIYSGKYCNKNMIPNRFLSGHEGSMMNTITNKDNLYLNSSRSMVSKAVNNIGIYISSEGKKYVVWETNINGKSYICAEEEGKPDGFDNDVLTCGKIVSEDYFKGK